MINNISILIGSIALISIVAIIVVGKAIIKTIEFDGGTYDDWYDEDEDTGIDGINDFKN